MNKVEAAVQAMQETTRAIVERVRPLPREVLVWRPAPEVWSILDNLAHIEEFVPFWIGEVQAMLADPPQPWGRDQSHAGRLAAVANTGSRNADELLRSVAQRVHHATEYLSTLTDDDLNKEAMSRNPRWARKPSSWVVDTLLVKHLNDHRGQIDRNLTQYSEAHH